MGSFFLINLIFLLGVVMRTWLRCRSRSRFMLIWLRILFITGGCIWFNTFLRGSWRLLVLVWWFSFIFLYHFFKLFENTKTFNSTFLNITITVDLILKETFDIRFNMSKILAGLITHSCDLIVNFSLEMCKNLINSVDFGIDFSVNSLISFDDTAEPFILNIFHFGQLLLHDSHSSFHINICIFLFLLINSVSDKMDELFLGGFLEALESSF